MPHGVPVQCIVRVEKSARGGGEDVTFSASRVVIPDEHGESQAFSVEHVYDGSGSERGIMERSITPALRAMVEGVSVSLVFLGASSTEKTSNHDSMVPNAVRELVDQLQVKSRRLGGGRAGRGGYRYALYGSFVQVYDEVVQDLTKPENRNLEVVDDVVRGIGAKGAGIVGPVDGDGGLEAVFQRGRGERTTAVTDFGPASAFTATIFQVHVVQTADEGDGRGESVPTTQYSVLSFIDTPGSEKLADDPETVRTREGPSLSKGILALGRVVRDMAVSDKALSTISPLRESALTHLMTEALGGNSLTVCIAHVQNGGKRADGLATMRLCQDLQHLHNFPLVNDDRSLGLLQRYRQELGQLREALAAEQGDGEGKGGAGGGRHAGLSEDDLLVKIGNLEGDVVRHNLGTLKLRDDNKRTLEKLMEFRQKYNDLVMSKARMQETMIQSEEDRLRVSKALMDLQIENSRLVSQAEADKYELVTKLLNAENDILEVESKEQAKVQSSKALEEEAQSLKAGHSAMGIELAAVRGHATNLQSDLQTERTRAEQLSLEILSLVNMKGVVEKDFEELQRESTSQGKRLGESISEISTLRRTLEAVEGKIREERGTVETLREEKVRANIQARQTEVAFKEKKVQIEQSMQEFTRERDRDLLNLKKGEEEGARRTAETNDQLTRQIKGLEVRTRQQHRKMLELERNLAAKMQDEMRLNADLAKMTQTRRDEIGQFRDRLADYIASFGLDGEAFEMAASDDGKEGEKEGGGGEGKDGGEQQQKKKLSQLSDPQKATKELLDGLVTSYKEREAELDNRLGESAESSKMLRHHNTVLQARYAEARGALEDVSPDAVEKFPEVIEGAEFGVMPVDDEEAATEVARLTQETANLRRQLDTEKVRRQTGSMVYGLK